MKAQLQRLRRETARVVERAQRVMRESRKLLEQREDQLRQMDRFLEQYPTISTKLKKASWRLALPVQPEITKNE
jgi:Na+/phosphate symporter